MSGLRARSVCFFLASACILGPARGELPAPPVAAAISADELFRFQYHGKPIPPACLWEFADHLADPLPSIGSVDLEGFVKGNRNSGKISEEDGSVVWTGAEVLGTGAFRYRFIGHTGKGVSVIWTELDSGGSGLFRQILLVEFSNDRLYDSGSYRDRTLITLRGSFVLGDRDEGTVEVRNGRVVVGKSKTRPAETVLPVE